MRTSRSYFRSYKDNSMYNKVIVRLTIISMMGLPTSWKNSVFLKVRDYNSWEQLTPPNLYFILVFGR